MSVLTIPRPRGPAPSGGSGEHAQEHTSGRFWKMCVGVGTAWVALYFLSDNPSVQHVMYPLTGLAAGSAVLLGVHLNRPTSRSPWVLFAIGLLLWTIGDTIWSSYDLVFHEIAPWPSAADAIYLIGTTFLGLGLIRMLRQRSPGRDVDGVIDALIVAAGVGTLSWAFFMAPYATDPGMTTLAKVFAIAYPVSDVILVVIVARLFLDPGKHSVSHRLLAAAVVFLLVSDVVYSVQGLNGSYYAGNIVDAGWLLFYVMTGAAALHRSMTMVTAPVVARIRRPSRLHFFLLAAAASLAPLTMLIQRERGFEVNLPMITAASVFVFILVVLRMERLVRDVAKKNDQLHSQGTLLRSSLDERTQLESLLRHQALHDPLTNLPNRVLFKDRLGHALQHIPRSRGALGLLFIDLDDFKTINDTMGHEAGDLYLAEVGRRLQQLVRTSDTAARLSGDEFALLLEGTATPTDAVLVAERVITAMKRPFTISGREVIVRVSIGVTWTDDRDTTPRDMQVEADIAMYEAKSQGRDRYMVFEPSLREKSLGTQRLRVDLQNAVADEQLRAVYQPIVDLTTGLMTGAEALVRWQHPVRGLVSPAEFLPLAEEAGIIFDLDMWMLRQACNELPGWRRLTPGGAFDVNVNLSAASLQHPDLISRVSKILISTGVYASDVVLELTESLLVGEVDTNVEKLRQLRNRGLRIAIDDFGTGYSSLAYLKRFPLDIIKIDKSFVDGVADGDTASSFAGTIVALAAQLHLSTVAEGVEHREQADALMKLGARSAQGFYFSRPVQATVVGDLIAGGGSLPTSETSDSLTLTTKARALATTR